jgi:hypothetical protein
MPIPANFKVKNIRNSTVPIPNPLDVLLFSMTIIFTFYN